MNWRQNPQRLAWVVLGVNLVACCFLSVAVPLGLRSFVLYATRSQPAYATALSGTVQVYPPGEEAPTAITANPRPVDEGSRIVTDPSTRALVSVFASGSNSDVKALTTVQLSQNSAMQIASARRPQFQRSSEPYEIALNLDQGRAYVTAQPSGERNVSVTVNTPQAAITLSDGSYDIMIEGDLTHVRAQSGEATVYAAGQQVTLGSGQRTEVAEGQTPLVPVSAALDLILNGSFDGRVFPPWEELVEVPAGLPPGEIEVVEEAQRNAVRFSRRTEDGAPNRVGIWQGVDRDVQGYDALTLRFDLKLMYQSVPGGGYLATEYPVMVDLFYTDIYGKDLHWYQGFYYLDLPPGSTYLPPTGEQIPLGLWYTYESSNLFELLQETRPARINSITLYASGHDYESLVSNVALTVR